MLGESQIRPWSQGVIEANRAETGLLELADLKRQQETAARVRQHYQANPQELLGGAGGSVLASPALTAGAGPMTQQTVIPGQPAGAPQVVPGGMDLSQFATGQPQSTLASLAPRQPNSLEALVRTDPDAALQVMQTRFKLQEQQLGWGEKMAASIGRIAQGVHDQASLDQARQEIAQIDPRAAAQLPQFYSKEAMTPFIERALSVKEAQTLKIQDLQAQSDAVKVRLSEQQAAAGVPKYTEDSTLNVAIDTLMQRAGLPRGTPPPGPILAEAQRLVEEGKVRVSAAQGSGQIKETQYGAAIINPRTGAVEYLRGPSGEAVHAPATQAEQSTATFANLAKKAHEGTVALETKGFQPGIWEKAAGTLPLGLGNYLTSEEARTYKTHVLDFAQAWLRKTSQGAVTPQEWQMIDELYFPQPGNSKAEVENKRKKRAAVIQELEEESKKTGRTGGQPTPSGGGRTSQGPLKPVTEMSREELLAERDRLRQGGR
jgi:hypothetical protein